MQLFSQDAEMRCIYTLVDADIPEKVRAGLLSTLTDDTFHYPPSRAAYQRIAKLAKKRHELIDLDDLVEDPSLDEDFRDAFRENSGNYSSITNKKQIQSLRDTLEEYRKLRICFHACKLTLETLQGDSIQVDEVMDKLSTDIAKARRNLEEDQKILRMGKKSNGKSTIQSVLYKVQDDLIPTGFTEFDTRNGGLPNEGVVILAGTTSGGKCIVGSSLVPTSQGLLRMDEMWKQTDPDTQNSQGFRSYYTDLHTSKGIHSSTKMYKTHGLTYKVMTNTGHYIEGLAEHKIWVYNKETYKFRFTRLDEITTDDVVPRTLGTNIFAEEAPKIDVGEINKRFHKRRLNAYRPGKYHIASRLPNKLNLDLARLLGYMVSEGSGLNIHNQDIDILNDIEQCAINCFGKRSVLRRRKVINIECIHLRYFFEAIGYTKVLSDKQKIPRIIREAPKEYQVEFLRSLFEGDGSIYIDGGKRCRIEYCTISHRLAYEVMAMLENMGIACFIAKGKTWATNGGKNQVSKNKYRLYIEKTSISDFINEIGFISDKKKERSKHYLLNRHITENYGQNTVYYSTGHTNYLPVKELLAELLSLIQEKKLGLKSTFGRQVSTFFSKDARPTKYFVSLVLAKEKEVCDYLKSERITYLFKRLRRLTSYVYSEVLSVKATEKEKPVYDFYVPGPHSYAVNGLMSHNSVLAMQLCKNIYLNSTVKKPRQICRVSFEMGEHQETTRLMSNLTGIKLFKFKQNKLTLQEKRKVKETYTKFIEHGKTTGSQFDTVCPTRGMKIEEVFLMLKPYGYNIIAIDYVSLLEGVDEDNQWRMLSAVVRQAKIYSRNTKTLVIVLAQLDTDTDKIRYSRGMKEHADVLWTWNYTKPEQRDMHVIPMKCEKYRDGELFTFPLSERFDIMQINNPSGEGAEYASSSKDVDLSTDDTDDDVDKSNKDIYALS